MELTADQMDALKELINIGVGKAADVLNQMIECHIQLQVPFIKIVTVASLPSAREVSGFGEDRLAAVRLGFKGPFRGTAALVFPTDSASKLIAVLVGDEPDTSDDLDSVRVGTLTEVGNIVINGVMGSIGNVLNKRIDYAVPNFIEDTIDHVVSGNSNNSNASDTVLLAQTRFTVEQLQIDGNIMMFFEVGSFDALIGAIEEMIA